MTEKETDVLIVGAGPTGLVLGLCEPERIAFARRLVATTDQAFTGVTSDGTM